MRALPLLALLAGCPGDNKVAVYNSPPEVSISQPVDGSAVDEGTIVTFEARVYDAQTAAPDLELTWSSDIDGIFPKALPADASGIATYSTAGLSVGNHTITLSALDEGAERASASLTLTVVEVPDAPTIQIVHPTGGESGVEAEDFEFVALVSDLQDSADSLIVDMESDVDGLFCTVRADAVGQATCTHALTPGDHRLTFTVTDTTQLTATEEWYFVVVAGTAIDDDGDGFAEEEGDCDDTTALSYPGGTEIEDGGDNDCDGTVDEGTNAYDDDGDGYSENDGDCDDTDVVRVPGGTESCNGYDDDCDGTADEEDASDCQLYYYDYDGDGYGSESVAGRCLCTYDGYYSSASNTDCYDYNSAASPAASSYSTSQRGDGSYDWNCDGSQSKYYTSTGSCGGWPGCSLTSGWRSSVASCGSSGDYYTGCSIDWFSCEASYTTYTQSCI